MLRPIAALLLFTLCGWHAAAGPYDGFADAVGGVAGVSTSRGAALRYDRVQKSIITSRPTRRGDRSVENGYLMLRFAKPLDLRGKALQFEVRATGLTDYLYLYLYNKDARKSCWAYYSYSNPTQPQWRTVTLQRHFSPELIWHVDWSDDSEPAAVDRLQLTYGVFNPPETAKIDLEIRNLRIVDPADHAGNLTAPVKLTTETVLAGGDTAPADILHPDTDAGRAAAARIADAVEAASGIRPACRPGAAADRDPKTSTILLGNIWNNPALLLAYSRRLTGVDHRLPGPGGWLVETVKEPFRRNVDLIVAGASDDAGLAKAAAALADAIAARGKTGRLALPLLFLADYAGNHPAAPAVAADHLDKGLESARQTLSSGRHQSLAGELGRIAERYRLYHQSADAKLFAAVARLYLEHSEKRDLRTYGGAWGHDSDFSAIDAISGLDVVEHDPVLTDEERLTATRMFQKWAHAVLRAKSQMGKHLVAHNHATFAAIGAMFAGLYFEKYYGDRYADGRQLLAAADAIFRPQRTSYKVDDDCNSYQWLAWEHIMRYAAARPDPTIIRNGVARKMIDGLIVTMDNSGYQVPYGDTGSWTCYQAETIAANIARALSDDPVIAWAADRKMRRWAPSRPAIYTRAAGEAPPEPAGFTGIRVQPLPPAYYRTFPPQSGKPAMKQCFDKISLRDGFDPAGFYAMIDGLNIGGHGHQDAQNIGRLQVFDRQWLADNDYYKGAAKFHNSLMLFRNGQWEPMPEYASLEQCDDTPGRAVVSTRLAGPTVGWTRHLVWLKPQRALAVLDLADSTVAGDAVLRQRWHGLGAVGTADPDQVVLTQSGGAAMRIQTLPGTSIRTADDYELGMHWAGYQHADRVVRVIDFNGEAAMRPGRQERLFALFHGAPDRVPEAARIEALAGNGVRFTLGGETYALLPAKGHRLQVLTGDDARRCRAASAETARQSDDSLPRLPLLWEQTLPAGDGEMLTAPAYRKQVPFRLTGTAPAAVNAFSPDEPNQPANLVDSAQWPTAGAAVLYEPNRTVTVNVEFDRPQQVSGIKYLAYWFANSRLGTRHQFDEVKIQLSSDNFRKDCREVAAVDDRASQYADSITPVPIQLSFPQQTAQQVRFIFRPRPDAAVYLGEVAVTGVLPETAGTAARPRALRSLRDGDRRLLAAGTGTGMIALYDLDGKPVGRFVTPAAVNALAAADLDGDGRDELIVGSDDAAVRVYRIDGKPVWERKIPYYRQVGAVGAVTAGDLDGDGRPEVVAGANNWRVFVYTADGRDVWNFEVVRESRNVDLVDLDGSGKKELLCTTKYYSMSLLTPDGKRRWLFRINSPGCRSAVTARTGDGGKRNVVFGADGGEIFFTDANGIKQAEFRSGDEIAALAVGEGKTADTVFAGSLNGFCYAFDPSGKSLWSRRLPGGVRQLATADGQLFAGTDNGRIVRLTPAGRLSGAHRLNGAVVRLLAADGRLLVLTEDGRLSAFRTAAE